MATIFIFINDYLYTNQYFQNILLFIRLILLVLILTFVFIASISYGFVRRQQKANVQDVSSVKSEETSNDIVEQREEEEKVEIIPISILCTPEIIQIDNSCDIPPEVPVIISNEIPIDKKISVRLPQQLICYCDGSYSSQSQIGYSGFRTSNGFSKYRNCPLRRPRSGSTESEVFAASLALQYTAQYHYDKLILYTDNSKVEQLLKRPKTKDYDNYPKFFDALEQCHQTKDPFDIQVERVRGHTSWYEQQECSIKYEFAKVDDQVRRKRRRHERLYINSPPISYTHRCGSKYIRVIHAEKFDTTLIISSSRRASSYF